LPESLTRVSSSGRVCWLPSCSTNVFGIPFGPWHDSVVSGAHLPESLTSVSLLGRVCGTFFI
ncbi:hypothetical protein LH413_22280, partial [Yersinia massiliensis]